MPERLTSLSVSVLNQVFFKATIDGFFSSSKRSCSCKFEDVWFFIEQSDFLKLTISYRKFTASGRKFTAKIEGGTLWYNQKIFEKSFIVPKKSTLKKPR